MIKSILDINRKSIFWVIYFKGFIPEISGINNSDKIINKFDYFGFVGLVKNIFCIDIFLSVKVRNYRINYSVNFFLFDYVAHHYLSVRPFTACKKSSIKSSVSSIPTVTLIVSSYTPAASISSLLVCT